MNYPNIIGVTGQKRSGKDSVAQVLVGTGLYKQVSFAHPIYEAVAKILDVPVEWVYHHKDEGIDWLGNHLIVRQLLQTLGTEWGRDMIDPEIWIKSCINRITKIHNQHYSVVVSDVRFINEALVLKGHYGTRYNTWKVTREGIEPTFTSNHLSEQEVDKIKFDFIIHNTGTLAQLKNQVLSVLEKS